MTNLFNPSQNFPAPRFELGSNPTCFPNSKRWIEQIQIGICFEPATKFLLPKFELGIKTEAQTWNSFQIKATKFQSQSVYSFSNSASIAEERESNFNPDPHKNLQSI